MLKKYILRCLREELGQHSTPATAADNALYSQDHYLTVVRIYNGYLLRFSSNMNMLKGASSDRIIYCADEKDLVEQISAQTVRSKLNIPTQAYNTGIAFP